MKNINITVKKNEEKVVPYIWINGSESEINFDAELIGEGANLTIIGIFIGITAVVALISLGNGLKEAVN